MDELREPDTIDQPGRIEVIRVTENELEHGYLAVGAANHVIFIPYEKEPKPEE